ncbi:hypothetical protein IKA15_01720 [bacterium]|nr:hypothetical protein [bacterium]
MRRITNVIEAISKHEDEREALRILEELGTNSPSDDVRELVSRFLVRRNTTDFLKLAIVNKGKGINDMSARVAMSTINELLTLTDKTEAMRILDETIAENSEKEVQDTARSVKALMCFGA